MALSAAASRPPLSICSLLRSETLAQDLNQFLDGDRYTVLHLRDQKDFFEVVEQGKHEIDCLILEKCPELAIVARHLHQQMALLPAVILVPEAQNLGPAPVTPNSSPAEVALNSPAPALLAYHSAEVSLAIAQLHQIGEHIERAIARFLKVSAACRLPGPEVALPSDLAIQNVITSQQRRLSEKLRERLGYLGVYYKREPSNFLRNLSQEEKKEFLDELRANYREIVLSYFRKDSPVNQKIDEFVTKAFFADISVSQVLEIHMELMDVFAKQLKLEGRSEDILLDYRLTLIDTIAHLCELYRRSIPREP